MGCPRESSMEAVMLIQRSIDCFEIVMEKESKSENYVYNTAHNTYDWIENVAQSLAEIYNLTFVNLAMVKQEVGQRMRNQQFTP